jgi:hypothetical protein
MVWRRGAHRPSRRFRGCPSSILELLALVVAASIGTCAAIAGDGLAKTLTPLESQLWPRFLTRLHLPAERAYGIIIQEPPLHAIDFRTAETAIESLSVNAGSLLTLLTGKAPIGHAMIAWQCATGRGFASATGDVDDRATTMVLRDGWGVTPMLSVFEDGQLDGPRGLRVGSAASMAVGRGNVFAVEVTERECQRLRRFVAAYISHPAQPARRYGLLLRPERFEGAGCMSFAVEVARRAGIFDGIGAAFRRSLDIPRSIIGRLRAVPDRVTPFERARSGEDQRSVSVAELLSQSWDKSAGYVRVTMVDPELVFASVADLRRDAGAKPDWRAQRALTDKDPAVARAVKAVRRWARRFPRHRIADPNGTSALVLELR